MILEYYKIRGTQPTRANPSDAGLDLYFNPEGDNAVLLQPGYGAVLQTGLKFGIPHGYMLEIKNRSGVAAKKSLIVGACVVDSGYEGEVFVNLHNIGVLRQKIVPGMKIAQAVLVPVVHFRAAEIEEEGNLYNKYPITISDRGDGALGSTDGKKN
tara:strand:- start:524 stop:988 length:465 start_codon:yes stop_codon:yes gene_type:complete